MTEQEWLACTDPNSMLEFLRGRASERKFRLYLCGGCRQITHLFFRHQSFACVEVAERFADGRATQEELERAEWDAESPTFGYELDNGTFSYDAPYRKTVVPRLVEIGALPESALDGDEWQVELAIRKRLLAAAELAWYCGLWSPKPSERYWQLSYFIDVDWTGRWLFDCIFGNPFRPVTVDPAWLTTAVVKLAQAIYDERRFQEMPILADALEEAGCTNADILHHCRSEGPHVRGCWVVDVILGKQ